MSTLLQREESKALIQIESSQLEFRRKRTGVNWVKWVNWLPSWRGDIEKSLDVYDFRIAPATEETREGVTMDEWYNGFSLADATKLMRLAPATEATHEGITMDAETDKLYYDLLNK